MLSNETKKPDVDCYFCNTTLIKGFNKNNKHQIVFIHVPKAENSLGLIENKWLNSEGDEPEPKRSRKNPILFDQAELNNLIKDLNLSKDKAKLLGFPLKEDMKMLLLKINYHAHCWSIYSDFKVIAILLELQTGFTKYCCFCYWDSRTRDKHYYVISNSG